MLLFTGLFRFEDVGVELGGFWFLLVKMGFELCLEEDTFEVEVETGVWVEVLGVGGVGTVALIF